MKKKTISDEVMSSIKEKKVTIKPKLQIILESLGPAGLIVLFIFIIILILDVIIHALFNLGYIKYLGLGKLGLIAFVASFPYTLLAVTLTLFIFANYLIRNYDISYKKPYLLTLTTLLVLTTATSIALARSKANNVILDVLDRYQVVSPLRNTTNNRNSPGIIARVLSISGNTLTVQSNEEILLVKTSLSTYYPHATLIEPGDNLVIVGEFKNGYLEAKAIRPLNNEQLRRFRKLNQTN